MKIPEYTYRAKCDKCNGYVHDRRVLVCPHCGHSGWEFSIARPEIGQWKRRGLFRRKVWVPKPTT